MTGVALRSLDGLRRIWFEIGATQQYYPLFHSAFWLQHRLWGDATLGYHIVTIVLHALSAFLVGLILRRIAAPGAWLAALIFALHPVHVESVAWISELKNTLSGAFVLGSAFLYLGFDETRRRSRYAGACALFALALASKSVTAVLPVLLLTVFWWRRGSVDWRRDLLPLGPFFLVGAAGGLTTAWVERTHIGATGAAFDFTFIERCLIAGRAFWFYLSKLVWPTRLMFTYPRWEVSQAVWWQYLFPLAAIALLVGVWMLRRRWRAPLAAMAAFAVALFPVLGFFNVYPFRFSFVADHFQYLASIPVIALFSAGATLWAARWKSAPRATAAALLVALGLPLALLTWNQSTQYVDERTVYEATLRENPSCWLALVNLGVIERDVAPRDLESAARRFREAIRLQPELTEAHYDLALTLQNMGHLEEAVSSYRRALRISPDLVLARGNLCSVFLRMGRLEEARAEGEMAVALKPDLSEARHSLVAVLEALGRTDEALAHLREAARLEPETAEIRYETGNLLQQIGRPDEALAEYGEALRLRPSYPAALANLGFALVKLGRTDEALSLFEQAIRLRPDYVDAYYYLGNALQLLGRLDEAAVSYESALRLNPADAAIHNNLGLVLEALGRPDEAAARYREALRLSPDLVQARDSLARVTAPRR